MYNIFDIVPCNMAYNTVLYLYYIVLDINCTITHYCTQYCTYICVISKYYIVHNIVVDINQYNSILYCIVSFCQYSFIRWVVLYMDI